jgi:methylmalonyl-CoA mutase N-terminal domain/subunit
VLDSVDPLAGSYAVEALTDELEGRITTLLDDIDARGGALACIESGWFAQQLGEGAYRLAQQVETGERAVIGVNRHASPTEPLEVFTVDAGLEQEQCERLRQVRAGRDSAAVDAALATLEEAAGAGENVVPACIAAVRAYATVGEIVDRLRRVHGSWTPSTAW